MAGVLFFLKSLYASLVKLRTYSHRYMARVIKDRTGYMARGSLIVGDSNCDSRVLRVFFSFRKRTLQTLFNAESLPSAVYLHNLIDHRECGLIISAHT
jgi:hypothetical protein